MKKITIHFILLIFISSVAVNCGNSSKEDDFSANSSQQVEKKADPKGVGEIRNVTLTNPLDESMHKKGKAIVEMKCASCHKLTDMRVVGPGFAGVTNRRTPEWIMNMITNTEVMIDEDPVAQELLELCLMRMPNQGLSVGDARDVLEFLRLNDIDKTGDKDQAAQ